MANPWEDEPQVDEEDGLTAGATAHAESRKDWIMCLVDARPCMQERNVEGKPMLACVFLGIAEMFKTHAVRGDDTRMGVMLLGAGEDAEFRGHRGLSMMLPVDVPCAASIRALTRAAAAAGASRSAAAATHAHASTAENVELRIGKALWAASAALADAGARPQDDKNMWIFTVDDHPACDASSALTRAKDCWKNGDSISLYPFQSVARPAFDGGRFWDALLAEEAEDGGMDGREVVAEIPVEGEEGSAGPRTVRRLTRARGQKIQVHDGTFDEFSRTLIQRAYKKRVYSRVVLTLADGVHIGVGVYANMYPAKKPAAMFRHAADNGAVKSETRYLDLTSGAPLDEAHMLKYVELSKGPAGRVLYTDAESKDVKIVPGEGRGLRLLGFKPLNTLRIIDNVRPPVLVYPLEGDVSGSTKMFRALWERMLARRVVAIARYEPRDNAAPRLVALYAARASEQGTDAATAQASPPGMYAIVLPYADDIRHLDCARPGDAPPTGEEVKAAEALVNALTVPGFDALNSGLANPTIQKFYFTLQSLALGEASSGWNDGLNDNSAPPVEGQQGVAEQELQAFAALFPEGASATRNSRAHSGAAGTKRARAERDGEDAPDIDWHAALAAGTIARHTVDELKAYLRANGLRLGGAKADLVARVTEHLSSAGGDEAQPAARKRATRVVEDD